MNRIDPLPFTDTGITTNAGQIMCAIAAVCSVSNRHLSARPASRRLVVSELPDGPCHLVEVDYPTGTVSFDDGMIIVLAGRWNLDEGEPTFSMNGRPLPVAVRRSVGRIVVSIWGDEAAFGVRSARIAELALIRPAPPSRVECETLCAPLPGLLLAVHALEGMRVGKGATVAVLEAMKMENRLSLRSNAVVTRVFAAGGALVAAGAPILEYRIRGTE